MTFWRFVAVWLALQPLLVLGWWALMRRRERRERARRRSLGARLAASASLTRGTVETLVARRPAGPAHEALRSAQLRALLDKTSPEA